MVHSCRLEMLDYTCLPSVEDWNLEVINSHPPTLGSQMFVCLTSSYALKRFISHSPDDILI